MIADSPVRLKRADLEGWEAKIAQQEGLLPDLTEDEYQALKADIAERGVQVPIERDETGAVLDGHHRLRACEELGITEYPTIIRTGMDEDEKREHVLALNLDRRHLTREQKRELVATLIIAKPETSNRQIAETAKVSPTTVGDVRSELESTVQIGQLSRTGMDEDEKRQHVLALNLDRRHLTGEQRTELTVKLRALGMSLRAIAEVEHVTQTTVARDLAGVTNVTPDAEPPAKVTGAAAWRD